jgi:magnesium-transporting ATPase (P-type)
MAIPANTPTEGTAWHALSTKEVTSRLATDTEKGLETAEASSRLQKYGPNRLPEGKKRGAVARFLGTRHETEYYVR